MGLEYALKSKFKNAVSYENHSFLSNNLRFDCKLRTHKNSRYVRMLIANYTSTSFATAKAFSERGQHENVNIYIGIKV